MYMISVITKFTCKQKSGIYTHRNIFWCDSGTSLSLEIKVWVCVTSEVLLRT